MGRLLVGLLAHHNHGADGVVGMDGEADEEDDEAGYEELLVFVAVVAEEDKAGEGGEYPCPVEGCCEHFFHDFIFHFREPDF